MERNGTERNETTWLSSQESVEKERNGMERNGTERNARDIIIFSAERNGTKLSGQRNGTERNGTEGDRRDSKIFPTERNGTERTGMERNGTEIVVNGTTVESSALPMVIHGESTFDEQVFLRDRGEHSG